MLFWWTRTSYIVLMHLFKKILQQHRFHIKTNPFSLQTGNVFYFIFVRQYILCLLCMFPLGCSVFSPLFTFLIDLCRKLETRTTRTTANRLKKGATQELNSFSNQCTNKDFQCTLCTLLQENNTYIAYGFKFI